MATTKNTLDDAAKASPPQSAVEAETLIAQALESPDTSPALKAILTPVAWYLHRLQREIDEITAPIRWIQGLKEKAVEQAAELKEWETFRKRAKVHPFGEGERHSTIWFTRHWQAPEGWSRVADAQDGPMGENHMVLWANPSLKAVAIEHEDGRAFIEHLPSTARFTEKMQSFQEIARNRHQGQEEER